MVVVWGECGRGVVDIGCRDNVMDEAGREWSLGGRKYGGTGNRACGVYSVRCSKHAVEAGYEQVDFWGYDVAG